MTIADLRLEDFGFESKTTKQNISDFPEEYDEETLDPIYRDSTFLIISKVAYLIGIPDRIFENPHCTPDMEVFDKLKINKSARIIRNLCMLRTAIERNFGKINKAIINDFKNITSLPEYVPQECITQLMNDGIHIYKANARPGDYIIAINKEITNRIGNCKDIFPIWVNWSYIKELFLMPGGTTEGGIRKAAEEYYSGIGSYPYQVYMNWPGTFSGNILYNDKKFVTLLYEAHEDYFEDISKVTDAGMITKEGIYDFLDGSKKVNLIVDCENSDPYRLYAMLKNLDQEALLSKIQKITLFDDVHTTSAWDILNQFTDIPVEHIEIERILENKSLVDIRLATTATRDFYKDEFDAFILASSDSDYWGMISAIPEARFLVMVEGEKCSPAMTETLKEGGYMYCYLDDFCTGNSNELKIRAVLREVKRSFESIAAMNINETLDQACCNARADMSAAERKQFYDRYIKSARLVIQKDGSLSIQLGECA